MTMREQAGEAKWPVNQAGEQVLPVNVFKTDHDLVITAPMPGVEPEDIEVSVSGKTVTLRAHLRGPGQHRRQYVVQEWSYGPYLRQIQLPTPVDAEHANASFGNGVLTVTLQKADREQSKTIVLKHTGAAHGHRAGGSGDPSPDEVSRFVAEGGGQTT